MFVGAQNTKKHLLLFIHVTNFSTQHWARLLLWLIPFDETAFLHPHIPASVPVCLMFSLLKLYQHLWKAETQVVNLIMDCGKAWQASVPPTTHQLPLLILKTT